MAARLSDGLLDPVQLAIIAAGLSRHYGVRVTVSGSDTASTSYRDGKATINIPALSSDDPAFSILVRGYIDHEVGHVRFTDSEAFKLFGTTVTYIELELLNILEDVFVERRMAGLYKGCGYNLNRIAKYLFTEHYAAKSIIAHKGMAVKHSRTGRAKPKDALSQLRMWILYNVRYTANPACGITADILASLDKGIAMCGCTSITDELRPIIARVPHEGTSTAANVSLAKELYAVLLRSAKASEAQSKKNKNSGSSNDSSGNNERITQSLQGLVMGLNELGTKVIGVERMKDAPLDGILANSLGLSSLASEALSSSINKSVGEAMAGCKEGGSKLNPVFAEFRRMSWGELNMKLHSFEPKDKYRKLADKTAGRLACKLQSLIQAHISARSGVGRSGGIDTHRLHRLAVNDARVFSRREIRRGLNTEFVLLCDASGSMIDVAIDEENLTGAHVMGYSVYSIMKAISVMTGAKASAFAFYGSTLRQLYSKGGLVRTPILPHPSGSTPLAEALIQIVPVFDPDPHSRRVIIFLTDGRPDNTSTALATIDRLTKMNFVVVGVGIGSNVRSIETLFSDSGISDFVSVGSLADMDKLPDALYSILRKHIIEGGL